MAAHRNSMVRSYSCFRFGSMVAWKARNALASWGRGVFALAVKKWTRWGDGNQPADVGIGVLVQLQHVQVVVVNSGDGGEHSGRPVLFVMEC